MPPTAAMPGRMRRGQVDKLAVEHLALDLEADEQEEHRHQAVVDPVQDREAQPT